MVTNLYPGKTIVNNTRIKYWVWNHAKASTGRSVRAGSSRTPCTNSGLSRLLEPEIADSERRFLHVGTAGFEKCVRQKWVGSTH
jgi:hypothetical protein